MTRPEFFDKLAMCRACRRDRLVLALMAAAAVLLVARYR
jgi:hypothetical protein